MGYSYGSRVTSSGLRGENQTNLTSEILNHLSLSSVIRRQSSDLWPLTYNLLPITS